MDLELSDDQRLLANSLSKLFESRNDRSATSDWRMLIELGLTGIPFKQADGGLALGRVETMLVGEAFGARLVDLPYLSSIVMAGSAVAGTPASPIRSRHLSALIEGQQLYALAEREKVTARLVDTEWRVSGELTLVLDGDRADHIVVCADEDLFIVAGTAAGVTRRGYRLHGGGSAGDLSLDNAPAEWLGAGVPGPSIEAGIAFLAAVASGAMQAALDLTIEHLKTRRQFDRPLAANQALQHRVAEMAGEVEQARSAALYAASLGDEPDPVESARGHAAVKATIGGAAQFVAQQAVHLHGGIGVCDEHVVSHYFRRLTAIGLLLGDSDHHLANLAALGGFTPAELQE